jgi:hypothetical protein
VLLFFFAVAIARNVCSTITTFSLDETKNPQETYFPDNTNSLLTAVIKTHPMSALCVHESAAHKFTLQSAMGVTEAAALCRHVPASVLKNTRWLPCGQERSLCGRRKSNFMKVWREASSFLANAS